MALLPVPSSARSSPTERPSVAGTDVMASAAGALDDEARPIVRMPPQWMRAVHHRELRVTKGVGLRCSIPEPSVERLHQRGGGGVIHIPHTHRDVSSSSIEDGARQPENA